MVQHLLSRMKRYQCLLVMKSEKEEGSKKMILKFLALVADDMKRHLLEQGI